MALSSREVAGMLVRLAAASEMPLNSIKLHKVMFLAHGLSWGLRGEGLILEPALAHRFGPLYSKVFDSLALFGAEDLIGCRRRGPHKALKALGYSPARCQASVDQWELVQAVWKHYGPMSTEQVVQTIYAAGNPWESTRKRFPDREDIAIPDDLIAQYFSSMARARQQAA